MPVRPRADRPIQGPDLGNYLCLSTSTGVVRQKGGKKISSFVNTKDDVFVHILSNEPGTKAC
jgi:hypothetical protein